MKRLLVAFIALVTADQLFAWLANAALQDGDSLMVAPFLRIGRWDHAIPIAHFAPLLMLELITLIGIGLCFECGARVKARSLALPITLIAAALAEQVIDMLARGYSVNYFGFVSPVLNWYWVIKLTDIAQELGIGLALYLVAAFAIKAFRFNRTMEASA